MNNQVAKDWKYIEFRCMIQDILGNEIYELTDKKLGDRTIFYCITIPGENEWVMRSNQEDGLSRLELSNPSAGGCDQDRLSISLVNYSFPIPDGKNKSCLIKVYDVELVDCLRVNDIVQIGGLIEPIEFEDDAELLTNKNSPRNIHHAGDPPTVNGATTNNGVGINTYVDAANGAFDDPIESMSDDNNFEPAKDFPERLVPRIHVKTLKKLPHINPLLPQVIDRSKIDKTRIKMARARLTTILQQLFGGDSLITEYLVLSLISRIHKRKDFAKLGHLTIGLSGFKPEMKFLAEKLYEIISKITTHSHYIELSIANLNNLRFTPRKDHNNNKMIAGTLQLPDGLHLMLNELALSEGQLTSLGLSNLNTLDQIIKWQKHKYDFKYHSVEIDTDLKILVISEGASILPVPIRVNIENNDTEAIASMREACEAVNDFLTEELLNMFRYYITSLMDVPDYEIPEKVQDCITENFVAWRKDDEANKRAIFSAEDLSSRMTLARYLTISRGETVLTHEIWEDVCRMESSRLARLKSLGTARVRNHVLTNFD